MDFVVQVLPDTGLKHIGNRYPQNKPYHKFTSVIYQMLGVIVLGLSELS
jgi:hypothetical protein